MLEFLDMFEIYIEKFKDIQFIQFIDQQKVAKKWLTVDTDSSIDIL